MWTRILAVSLLTVSASLAQDTWQLGALAGYGFYRNVRVFSPEGRAQTGIRDRFVAGAVLTEDLYEHLSGEVRYIYQDGDPFLMARGIRQNIQGQSHTFHYDFLIHLRDRDQRVRPYVAVGAGAKLYRVSGSPQISQPLGEIATLTTEDDWRPLISVGGGVKLRVQERVTVSVDFRDYITTFPKRLIAPVPFGTARGLFQQFTPTVGLSYSF
ncbi:MAG TPA: hypothetical protein VN442_04850 [Bryobacteraceae bacterium]|nr:hypothetical protein [Bryobacteraceae bacterium]